MFYGRQRVIRFSPLLGMWGMLHDRLRLSLSAGSGSPPDIWRSCGRRVRRPYERRYAARILRNSPAFSFFGSFRFFRLSLILAHRRGKPHPAIVASGGGSGAEIASWGSLCRFTPRETRPVQVFRHPARHAVESYIFVGKHHVGYIFVSSLAPDGPRRILM